MAVTIKQIAEAAGVSRGTVDRVLHNRSGVNTKIAAHVRHIADEMGYAPNRAGKILAAKKQPLRIGCFLPSIGNPFFIDVVRGLRMAEAELRDFGVSVRLKEIRGYDAQVHIRSIRQLAEQEGCAALCLSTIDIPEIRSYVNALIDRGIPVVAMNTDLSETRRLCYVGSDYFNGGSTAAGLLSLMASEHLNILIVTGSLKMKGHNERMQGFLQTLDSKHTDYDVLDIFETQDSEEIAYQKAMVSFSQHPTPNCVYVIAAGAGGVCRAMRELGREFRYVITNDDVPTTQKYLMEGLIDFTVCQEPVQQGYHAIHKIFDYFMSDRKSPPGDYLTSTVIKIKENLG